MTGEHFHPDYDSRLAALEAAVFPDPTPDPDPVPEPEPTPDPEPTPEPGLLRFRPPELFDPTIVQVSATNRGLKLDPARDYVIVMPDVPLDVRGGLSITGGRNVVLIGGEISFSADYSYVDANGNKVSIGKTNRGLQIQKSTGIVHVEGLKIGGTPVGEGINISAPDALEIHLCNVEIETTSGSRDTNHADLVQTWAGPRRLLVDGFVGRACYQGFFLLPTQWAAVPGLEPYEFHNAYLDGTDAGYLFYLDDSTNGPVPAPYVSNVWCTPNPTKPSRDQFLWPQGSSIWDNVGEGEPPTPIVTGAGLGYTTPGYQG
jgi:hypothetical protein